MKIYESFLKQYGLQGWWPLLSCKGSKAGERSGRGYHPGDYSYPKNTLQRFEICTGAILTQNTAWTNVEKALNNLRERKLLNAESIMEQDIDILKESIKPAGYYNQKAKYLKEFAVFYLSLKGRTPSREDILAVKGIGPETADSILLYAYSRPEFVVDAYTKRIFSHLKFFDIKAKYHEIKILFEKQIPKDYTIYQEYHALIVEHAKNHYSKRMQSSKATGNLNI